MNVLPPILLLSPESSVASLELLPGSAERIWLSPEPARFGADAVVVLPQAGPPPFAWAEALAGTHLADPDRPACLVPSCLPPSVVAAILVALPGVGLAWQDGFGIAWRSPLGEGRLDAGPASDDLPETPPQRAQPPQRRSLQALLVDLRLRVSWGEPAHEIDALREDLLARFPDAGLQIERYVAQGLENREATDQFERALPRMSEIEARATVERIAVERPHLRKPLEKKLAYQYKERSRPGPSTVRARGDHRLLALPPADHWTLLVDETGERFDADVGPKREGRLVAIAIPDGATLPPLKRHFHAADEPPAACDAALQALLDAPVGVLGLSVQLVAQSPQRGWEDDVHELLALALRLLPLPADGPARVEIGVERRGAWTANSDWSLMRKALIRELAMASPERAARLTITLRVLGKGGHPGLGYADVVAHAWGSPNRDRVARSGLLHTSLLDRAGEGGSLRAALDAFGPDRSPSPETWAWLVSLPHAWRDAAPDPASVAGHLLLGLAARCRDEPELWRRYVEVFAAAIDAAAPDLDLAGRQATWLALARPPSEGLSPRLKLALALSELARANHLGEIDRAEEAVSAAAAELIEEAAPLSCLADLHVAVRRTNRFAFARATRALWRWQALPLVAPGLRNWGRVRSSLGQHAAFMGDPVAARALFEEALDAFGRLADPADQAREREQTAAYRAIASMDDPAQTDAQVLEAVRAALGPLDPGDVERLAAGGERDRYRLHVLHRWAVARPTALVAAAVLAARPRWQTGDEHPWPLVQMYRAILTARAGDPAAARLLAKASRDQAVATRGPTVRTIGLVLGLAAESLGEPFPAATALRDELERALPDARPWIAAAFAARGAAPETILAAGLPFNFR